MRVFGVVVHSSLCIQKRKRPINDHNKHADFESHRSFMTLLHGSTESPLPVISIGFWILPSVTFGMSLLLH